MRDFVRGSALCCAAIALVACQADDQRRYSSTPTIASADPSHRQLLGAADADNCSTNEDGTWDCVWEGPGMSCTYGVSATDELLYQYCSGPWGRYDCDNNGSEIVCLYAADGGECTDVWSLDYQLIDTTCDYGYPPTEEDCVTGEDGMTTCTWSDGFTTCVVVYDENDQLIRQDCSDERMEYNCTGSADVVECVMLVDGEVVCTDTWTQTGEPIELGCSEEYPDDPGECPGPDCPDYSEDCTTDGDNTTCVSNDGYVACTYSYDSNGVIFFVDCDSTDGWMSYDCAVEADGLLHCIYREGEEVCEEVVADNEIVSTTCDYYEEPGDPSDPSDPSDPGEEWSCERNDDGSETCIYDDGCTSCTVRYEAIGPYIQECTDGTYVSICEPDGDFTACSIYLDGESLCTDLITWEGEVIDENCTAYASVWGATCG